MSQLENRIEQALKNAVVVALGEAQREADPMLRPAQNPRFGDYQANLAMGLAKQLGQKPRDLAQKIADALPNVPGGDSFQKVEVAGPGFINLTLTLDALNETGKAMLGDPHLLLSCVEEPRRVVVDYSSPNVAKEMHVGHLRSTIIGDAVSRVLSAKGHVVIRQNHLGDWGTQFGMLIENLLEQGTDLGSVRELTAIYQAAKKRFDAEPEFQERAKQRVVKLQGGDEETLKVWRQLVDQTIQYLDGEYKRMGVLLEPEDVCGESFYNPMLPGVVERLKAEGHLVENEGAQCVFPEGFKNKQGDPLPMIVQKRDGGYLYATTDLAAVLHRTQTLGATWLIYVIGLPQFQHVDMLKRVVTDYGWIGPNVTMQYVGFGSVLGTDGKLLRTRSGGSGTVKLSDLLDEAEEKAAAAVKEKNPDLDPERTQQIARAIGIGALKYADLSSDRVKDYVFDWDRMLAFNGNTAPYLVNAYVRTQSIFRKAKIEPSSLDLTALAVKEDAERALLLQLVRYAAAVESVAASLEPHRLCGYLYDVASAFHPFFEKCPVIKGDVAPEVRASRLALCELTARVLRQGLGLLGIQTVQQM
ncbi:MAG: arginine--tRNA ligase [Polyangiaceae bacterium]